MFDKPMITLENTFLQEVIKGLTSSPKRLPSKYFYDDTGDKLFQQIMTLEAYYPTRCEAEIFDKYAAEWANNWHDGRTIDLIELGAGDGQKTLSLLKALTKEKVPFNYLPVDISADVLGTNKERCKTALPYLNIQPMVGEYFEVLKHLPKVDAHRRVLLLLGGNIGNMERDESDRFLAQLARLLMPDDLFLLGADLQKDPDILLAAYNDAKGVTAEFNYNLLRRINRELEADFDLTKWKHWPCYVPQGGLMQSYLVSTEAQRVSIGNTQIAFEAWEAIHTEFSIKYTQTELGQMAERAGFTLVNNYSDSKAYFVNSLWRLSAD